MPQTSQKHIIRIDKLTFWTTSIAVTFGAVVRGLRGLQISYQKRT